MNAGTDFYLAAPRRHRWSKMALRPPPMAKSWAAKRANFLTWAAGVGPFWTTDGGAGLYSTVHGISEADQDVFGRCQRYFEQRCSKWFGWSLDRIFGRRS